LHEKGEIHDVYMRYLDLYKDIPEIKKQARWFINGNSHTVAIFLTVLENNTKLQKSWLTLTTVTEHLWDRWINPVRESFTKNAEDLYNDIKSAINKEFN
jgi:hypothetical protein